MLAGEGYRILEAENGTRALQTCSHPEVDLVILDIMMPGMSGLRVCEELRKASTVPILFLTAKSQESDKLLGLTAGGDDYLAKAVLLRGAQCPGQGSAAAVLRLSGQRPGRTWLPQPEDLKLHFQWRAQLALDCNRVWVDEREVDLTETEYKILQAADAEPRAHLLRCRSSTRPCGASRTTLRLQRHGHGPHPQPADKN